MTFNGDKKIGFSLLGKWEKRFLVDRLIPHFPSWLNTHHLTLSTIIWSALIIVFCYLAQKNIHWMWATSVMVVMQYITDKFDGPVGKYRNTGLVLWGYYMDHFLDYIFLCSVLIGYSFLFAAQFPILFFILAVFGAFMVNSYLAFAVTNHFKITYFKIGPTEIRIGFIVINTLIIFGRTHLARFLPLFLVLALIGLIIVVHDTQKEIWRQDMENKKTLLRT